MDVAALAQTILMNRNASAMQDAQVSLLRKAMDVEANAAVQLIDKMALPLATEGAVGRNVNTYA
ncbi:hypothetical protein BJY21_002840 [Kineosphaera limosa]|uniref:Motility protein n=1 Tax=Kineosphaera limosa NBRC 100340 TaxID=1184609 RepID=K6WUE4_9MICO|nr:YjfB family protein [Kineosphaera limosa]NYE01656.1 hypothetical protein [Kineosphaera limosa]GAB97451.1 hypothetical protein KILIM_069_00190 [Kineosphaera limosa NBRC 100340]